MTRPPRVDEVIARVFAEEGLPVVFNVMGDGNKHFLVEMARAPGVRLCNARHEGAALAMADGATRTGAGVGVCSVTYGPGGTQLTTSLMVASKHRSPLVVFAGDITAAERDSGSHLDFDARRMFEACGALVLEVRQPSAAGTIARAAFRRARLESRPVVVLAASDVQEELVDGATADSLAAPAAPGLAGGELGQFLPPTEEIRQACVAMARWQRPLLLAGQGVLASEGRNAALEVAERLGALLCTTFLGKGLFDGEPDDLGIAGGFAFDSRRALFEACDGVLVVGSRLTAHTTDGGRLFPAAEVICVDLQPALVGVPTAPIRQRLAGDARRTLAAIAEVLAEDEGARPTSWQVEARRSLAGDPRLKEIEAQPAGTDDDLVDPRRLMLALDEVLPDDADIVVGGGHSMAFPMRYLRRKGARRFLPVFDFMTTGQALPSSIGAALAGSGRPVVGFEGDASFLMHVQELETAARYAVPLLFFVLNDQALGAEVHRLEDLAMDPSEAIVPTPDLAGLAVALGGRGMALRSLDDVAAVASWYEPSAGPHVVDCRISRAVRGPI